MELLPTPIKNPKPYNEDTQTLLKKPKTLVTKVKPDSLLFCGSMPRRGIPSGVSSLGRPENAIAHYEFMLTFVCSS